MLKEVDFTNRKVENVVKGLIQKVSTLFGSKLPSVAILERLDGLEKSFLDKNIQLKRFMESKNVDTETENKLKSKIEELEGKIHSKESNLSKKLKIWKPKFKDYNLEFQVMTNKCLEWVHRCKNF
ncbi:hypothetical protein AVEN_257671-1 [Araneus ventricosus]|uniref:Uncharacterized protein n=1 Tax=Araneus ventricosus TaxID=182803 RepID=A0A4Y2LEW6_ARAVE|nr:hypothetical protein AVEN_257671-1 [Araneus ventricosus]